jgi:hypothetical protein
MGKGYGKIFIQILLFCGMTDLVKKLNLDYLLGCIKYRESYGLYALPLGWWILNYYKYDTGVRLHAESSNFRNGVFNGVDSEVENFIDAIENDKVTPGDFKLAVDASAEDRRLKFFIDFDGKRYINGYYENVEPEEYLPDDAWRGEMGFPIEYLPNEIRIEFVGLS